jgi:excisionase family DNA binding protein
MLTGAQVRERLAIGKTKFRDLIQTGELPAIKIGTAANAAYRISEEDLAAFIDRQTVKPIGIAS